MAKSTRYYFPAEVALPAPLKPWDTVDLLTALEWLKSGGVVYRPIGLRRLCELGRLPGAAIVAHKWRIPRATVEAIIQANTPEAAAARLMPGLDDLLNRSPFEERAAAILEEQLGTSLAAAVGHFGPEPVAAHIQNMAADLRALDARTATEKAAYVLGEGADG